MCLPIGVRISHPSTNQARPCLASEIRRDRARSGWYGRIIGVRIKQPNSFANTALMGQTLKKDELKTANINNHKP